MKIKTKGQCTQCNETFTSTLAKKHSLNCTVKDVETEQKGLLVKVSCLQQPSLYWMIIALSKNTTLIQLDTFLRNTWLECCGHLSEFTIEGHSYLSHTESGAIEPCMNSKVGQLVSPGMKFVHAYDMGSTTELKIEILENIPYSVNKIKILMKNEPPVFPCESCGSKSENVCTYCSGKMCDSCINDHSCTEGGNIDGIARLCNSPRTGVCGYQG